MIYIRQRIIFDDPNNPESGYLLWHFGTQFTICDIEMNEVDSFNVNNVNGDINKASHEAIEHFCNLQFISKVWQE